MASQKADEDPNVQRKMPGNPIVKLFEKLAALYVRGVYREYPIVDDNGKIIGYEFASVRGGAMIRVINEDRDGVKDHE